MRDVEEEHTLTRGCECVCMGCLGRDKQGTATAVSQSPRSRPTSASRTRQAGSDAGGGNPGAGPVDSQHYGNPQPGERRGTNWGGHGPGAGAKQGPGFKRAGSVYPGFGDDEEMTI